MPTGYTDYIKEGITFNQFAIRCARAFGACIEMRDEDIGVPIPEEFKPSDYHKNALIEAKQKLAEFEKMTLDKAMAQAKISYAEELNARDINLSENTKQIKLYKDMLEKVKSWIPPTEEHVEFKEFMILQIEGSIEHDDMSEYYADSPIKKLTAQDWIDTGIAEAQRDIEYHTAEYEKEIQRVNGRNNWIRNLRESLTPPTLTGRSERKGK